MPVEASYVFLLAGRPMTDPESGAVAWDPAHPLEPVRNLVLFTSLDPRDKDEPREFFAWHTIGGTGL